MLVVDPGPSTAPPTAPSTPESPVTRPDNGDITDLALDEREDLNYKSTTSTKLECPRTVIWQDEGITDSCARDILLETVKLEHKNDREDCLHKGIVKHDNDL